jgi:hypothetical protein
MNMPRKRLIDKKEKKADGKCRFCPTDDYALLDVHRIIEGKDGGQYTEFNTVTVCSLCHRKIHAGKLKILGKNYSTSGRWMVRYLDEEGQENWV